MSTATIDNPFQSESVGIEETVGDEFQVYLVVRRMNFGWKDVGITEFPKLCMRTTVVTFVHLQIVIVARVGIARPFEVKMREGDVDLVTYGGVNRPAAVRILLVRVREIGRFYHAVEAV